MQIDNFISAKKPDKELPALKELAQKASMQDIFEAVELAFSQDKALARNAKMNLSQKYTGKKLKDFGLQFGIGDREYHSPADVWHRRRKKIRN
jgi:hypothetical protein